MKLTKKKKVIALAMVAIAAVCALLFTGKSDGDQTIPSFSAVEGPLTIGITSSGSIQSRDKVVLRSELEGGGEDK